jgi:hypothetical protein
MDSKRGIQVSEAHEKTRIRQLEDAAAHWEHKYTNARQYNRNLEARIGKLEAALRSVLTLADIDKPVDADALADKVRAAWQVLGSGQETSVEPDSQCVTTLSGKHWWIKQDDGMLKCQSCNKTSVKTKGDAP